MYAPLITNKGMGCSCGCGGGAGCSEYKGCGMGSLNPATWGPSDWLVTAGIVAFGWWALRTQRRFTRREKIIRRVRGY